MDSTLLDQIRYLCRDRAAYEHLKAILVQQERVHQLGWEERYANLLAAQTSDTQPSNLFSNIIAREKALAQLADAIQRSPSLELVLQIAVQVAQKLLQVDRVAIFRCHPDGRGEFAIDAIAAGMTSLADMPERQLSLARHMIESTDTEHSAHTIDSIRSSSLSSHIVTLLEQIGISSYAANKIYAGQEHWGTLAAFHGSAYHSWSESDRTSLSLIAAQIGIAISLTNLRQQSQNLTDDLQILRVELDNLQQIVAEIAKRETEAKTAPNIEPITPEYFQPEYAQIIEPVIIPSTQDVVKDVQDDTLDTLTTIDTQNVIEDVQDDDNECAVAEDLESENLESEDLKTDTNQVQQDLHPVEDKSQEISEDLEADTYIQNVVEDVQDDYSEDVVAEDLGTDTNHVEQDLYIVEDELQEVSDEDLEADTNHLERDLHPVEDEVQETDNDLEENIASEYLPITQNGLPLLFLIPASASLSEDGEMDEAEDLPLDKFVLDESVTIQVVHFDQVDISYMILPDQPKMLLSDAIEQTEIESQVSESGESGQETIIIGTFTPEIPEYPVPQPEEIKAEESEQETIIIGSFTSDIPESQVTESEEVELAQSPQEAIALESDSQASEIEEIESEASSQEAIAPEAFLSSEILDPEDISASQLSEPEKIELRESSQGLLAIAANEPEIIAAQLLTLEESEEPELEPIASVELNEPQAIELKPEIIESEIEQIEQIDDTPVDLETYLDGDELDDNDEPAIDPKVMETILEISNDDHEAINFLLNVIDSYLEDAPHLVQEIDKALAINDQIRLLQSLNTLRSNSDYVGALTLSYQCRQLESAVKANYVVLVYACLSRVAIEVQRATDALRIERSRYADT